MSMPKKSLNKLLIRVVSLIVIVFLAVPSVMAKTSGASLSPADRETYICYHYLAAFVALYEGDSNRAIREIREVLKLEKKPLFYSNYATMLVHSGKTQEAEKVLKKALKLFPKNRELYNSYVNVLLSEYKPKEAAEFIKNHIDIFGKTVETYRRLGFMYMQIDPKKAIPFFKKAAELHDDWWRTYLSLARCLMDTENYKEAEKYMKEAEKLNPSYIVIKLELASIYEAEGKYKKAIEIYKKINSKLKNGEIYAATANDYYMLGDLDKAMEYFKKAYMPHRFDEFLEKYLYLAIQLKRYREAEKFIKEPRVSLDTPKEKYLYGYIEMQLGKYREALKLFSSIGKKSKLYKTALYNRALCLIHLNEEDKALNLLRSIKNKNDDVLITMASLYAKTGKYTRAINIIKQNIDTFQNKARAYFFLADLYYQKLKDRKACIKYLKKALKLDPKNPDVLNYLGYLYIDENINIPEGMKLVEKALKIQPDNPYFLDSLGWGYYKTGNYRKALLFLQKAIKNMKNHKDDAVIRIHIAKTYMKLNKKGMAINILKETLRLHPDNKEAARLLNSLK